MPKIVPSELYNDQYYLGHGGCEGVEIFQSSKGKQLSKRLQTVLNEIVNYKDKKILELGCGRGEIALHLEEEAKSMICVDYSQSAFKIASSILKKAKLHCVDAVEFLPSLKDEVFDIVLMNDFLEHLYDWQIHIIFKELNRLTITDSIIYINIPIIPHASPSQLHVNIPPNLQSVSNFMPDFDLIKNIITDAAGSDHLLIYKRR